MSLSNLIPKHLQDTFSAPIEHVYNLFTGSSNEDSTSSQILSPTRRITPNANLKSNRMPEIVSPRENKILENVLAGTYGSEILIEDEDTGEKRLDKVSKPVSISTKATERVTRQNNEHVPNKPESSEEEDWLLGNASRKSPPDATKILDPMSRFKTSQKQMGYRPLNTLSRPDIQSSQSQYRYQKTRGEDLSPPQSKSVTRVERPHYAHPNKRQRIGISPKETRTEVINLDDSQELESEAVSAKPSMKEIHRWDQRSNGLSRLDGNQVGSEEYPDDVYKRRNGSNQKSSSSHDLKIDRDNRENRQGKRHAATNAGLVEQKLNGLLRSSLTSEPEDQPLQNKQKATGSVSTSIQTPKPKSRLAARLAGESPDELQSDDPPHKYPDEYYWQNRSNSSVSHRGLKSSNGTKRKKSPEKHDLMSVPIKAIVGLDLPAHDKYTLVVNKTIGRFFINHEYETLSDDPVSPRIPLDKVISILWPKSADCFIAAFAFSRTLSPNNKCYIEFKSQKGLRDFQMFIEEQNYIKTTYKECSYLAECMANAHAAEDARAIDATCQTLLRHHPGQGDKQRRTESQPVTEYRETRATEPANTKRRLIDFFNQPNRTDRISTEAPNLLHDGRPIRYTRSSSNLIQGNSGNIHKGGEVFKNTIPRREGIPWQTELTYPPTGRKRETVSWEDLHRLEDDEFLNDNLVGLFLRYLQEHIDSEVLKKMHFFSSFFFEKLMNSGDVRGARRQINYKGVSTWTKNLNLFSRDFVVVPVNENLHWYVMIICNLPELKKKKQEQEEEDQDEPLEFQDQAAMSSSDNFGERLVEDLTGNENSSPPNSSSKPEINKKGRRKSHKPPHRKYDVKKPIIITLDSLNIPRSSTATALKQYIVEEARTKLQLEIEQSEIQGMTAKGIPLQSNWSDCGLYVCMYVEQFMQDPYGFVHRILQRDDAGPRWPKKIESRDLRQKFYVMLQELHSAQHEKRQANLSNVGSILVNMEREEIGRTQLDAASVKEGAEFYRLYQKESNHPVDEQYSPSESRYFERDKGNVRTDQEDVTDFKSAEEYLEEMNRPINISDDESRSSNLRTPSARLSMSSKSKYFNHDVEPHTEMMEDEEQRDLNQVPRHEHGAPSSAKNSIDSCNPSVVEIITMPGKSRETQEEWDGLSDEVPETEEEPTIAESVHGDDEEMLMQ